MLGLSFVIPYYNSQSTINLCVQSIKSQAFEFPIEIIVVDNNSTVPVKNILETDCKIIFEQQQGRSYARNAGARESLYDYICFLDSDVQLDLNWLQSTVSYIKKTSFDGYEGFIKNKGMKSEGFLDIYRNIFRGGNFNIEDSTIRKFPVINSACCVYKKSSFEKIGGFDNQLNWCEDADLSKRMFLAGGNLSVLPHSYSFCYYSGTIFTYIKRKFYAGVLGYHYLMKWENKLDSMFSITVDLLKKLFSSSKFINVHNELPSNTYVLFHRFLLFVNFLGHIYARLFVKEINLDNPNDTPHIAHENKLIKQRYNIVLGREHAIVRDTLSKKMHKVDNPLLHMVWGEKFNLDSKKSKVYFFLEGNIL